MISKLTLFEHDKVKDSEQNLQFEDVVKVIFGRSPDVIEHYYND